MPLAVNEIVQITWRTTFAAQQMMCVHAWKCTSTASASDLLTDLNNIAAHFSNTAAGTVFTHYRACIGSDVIFYQTRAQVIRPARSLYMTADYSLGGTAAGTSLSPNTAMVFTRASQGAGRSGISNTHLGPLCNAWSTGSLINVGGKTAMANLAADMIAQQTVVAGTIKLDPVIVHPIGAIIVSTPIVTYRIQDTIRVMRRRTVGLGI